MELGLYTFADVGPEIDPAQRLRNLLEEIELADQVGLDVFGVGEHHRPDYAVSSPAVALAAAAARTKNIRLSSAVTVLRKTSELVSKTAGSSGDPRCCNEASGFYGFRAWRRSSARSSSEKSG